MIPDGIFEQANKATPIDFTPITVSTVKDMLDKLQESFEIAELARRKEDEKRKHEFSHPTFQKNMMEAIRQMEDDKCYQIVNHAWYRGFMSGAAWKFIYNIK